MRAALRTATDLVLLFGAALLVRIPQLLGDGRLLDGDEAIVGLMARRLLVAGEAPLVFWGQRYGLSVVEAGAVSGSYGVLGYGDLAVRVGSLVVFALGAFCFLRALLRLDPPRPGRARVLALLLVTAPAWGVWALKARGGYGTALAGTFLALYLGLVAAERRRALWPFLAGAAVGLAGAAQPLWLPGAALLTAAALGGRSAPRSLGAAGLGVLAVAALVVWGTPAGAPAHAVGAGLGGVAHALGRLPALLLGALTNTFYLELTWPAAWPALGWALLFLGALAWGAVHHLRAVTHHPAGVPSSARHRVASAALLASALSLLPVLLLERPGARYLLPFFGYGLVFLATLDLDARRAARALTVLLGLTGALAVSARTGWLPPRSADLPAERTLLLEAVDTLRARGATEVLSAGPLLQWQVMFYSAEAVRARFRFRQDRYPPYAQDVNAAWAANGVPAILGTPGDFSRLEAHGLAQRVRWINPRYGLVPRGDSAVARALGFEAP